MVITLKLMILKFEIDKELKVDSKMAKNWSNRYKTEITAEN